MSSNQPSPKATELVVGIDLGTTNSLAAIRAGKGARVLRDAAGEALIPSVVCFHPDGRTIVGRAAKALRLVIPEIEGKLDGLAYRVPTPTVSIVEIVALTERDTTKEEVNRLLAETAGEKMKGILGFTTDPVVSMDMKGDERSSIVDGQSTNVVGGNLVKVAAWYDNEWGYACRISDLCSFLVDKGI